MKLLNIGLIISPMFFLNGCLDKSNIYTIKECIDSIPRLTPDDAVIPKSSFNPNLSLICYYDALINTIYFETQNKKGNFKIKSHGELVTFHPHNLDSIFFLYNDTVALYNSSGKLLKTMYYKRKFEYNGINFKIGKTMIDFPNIAYDNQRGILFLPCTNYETNWWDLEYFKRSMLLVGLEIKTGNVVYYPLIKYPIEYSTNFYGESFNFFYTLKNNNELYISYNALPDVFKYCLAKSPIDVEKISLTNLKEAPQYDKKYNEDLNMVLQYQKRIDTYWKIIYDPYKKVFYRFHTQPTNNEIQKKHGSYQSNFDVILIIYNEKFEELKRLNLGDSVNHYGSFVSYKGIHIKMYKPSPNYEYFKIISISN